MSKGERSNRHRGHCTDPVVGAILSGWRYDISGLSPETRTDYDAHLATCSHCRQRQHLHRTVDVLLISVSTLSICAFLLAIAVIHRVENITHMSSFHVHLRDVRVPTITVPLEGVAIAGLVVSMILWALVAMMTPLPGLLRERIPEDLRDRIFKHAS
jgi:hypothetical protein